MIQRQSKSQPKWTDVKAKLASFDRAGLLGLVQDLYAAHTDTGRFFTLVLDWARTFWNRTSRPLTGGLPSKTTQANAGSLTTDACDANTK
jgi:hypothetical protein